MTDQDLAEIERHANMESVSPSEVLALAAEVRRLRKLLDGENYQPGAFDRMTDWAEQMENERDGMKMIARELLGLLIEEGYSDSALMHYRFLLEPEPMTATGVAEAVFGMVMSDEEKADG